MLFTRRDPSFRWDDALGRYLDPEAFHRRRVQPARAGDHAVRFRAAMDDKELAAVLLDGQVLPQVEHDWLASRQ